MQERMEKHNGKVGKDHVWSWKQTNCFLIQTCWQGWFAQDLLAPEAAMLPTLIQWIRKGKKWMEKSVEEEWRTLDESSEDTLAQHSPTLLNHSSRALSSLKPF